MDSMGSTGNKQLGSVAPNGKMYIIGKVPLITPLSSGVDSFRNPTNQLSADVFKKPGKKLVGSTTPNLQFGVRRPDFEARINNYSYIIVPVIYCRHAKDPFKKTY